MSLWNLLPMWRRAPELASPRQQSGFTLIEVMISLAILGIIVAILYGSFWTVSRSYDEMRDRLEVEQAGRFILENLNRELRSAYLSPDNESLVFEGLQDEVDGQPRDSIRFFSTAPAWGKGDEEPELKELSYSLEASETDPGVVHLYRRTASPSQEAGQFPEIDLGPYVQGLSLRYSDGEDAEVESWDSKAIKGERRLPAAIQIDLILGKGEWQESLTATVALPVGR